MYSKYPRGSEWRKWDLQVHTPGTRKNDQYKMEKNKDVWKEFCKKIYESDVMAFGICDYFSSDNYFVFIKGYFELYPDSNKVFFPNIELYTSDVVDQSAEEVNIHLIFNPETPELEVKIKEFLNKLETTKTNASGRYVTCSELSTEEDYEGATTSRDKIESALESTFGRKIEKEDYVFIISAINNDGARAQRGKKRKEVISDEIDKFSNAFFGNSNNVEYCSKVNRLESDEEIVSKPVFSSSDCHSFGDLDNYLGKEFIDEQGNVTKQVTWIKADLCYEGLKQTIYEPISGERVFIGNSPPDTKSPDRVIKKVTFKDTDEFPNEVSFNGNLSSIIGSRSSGKSALLAYLAYAVDPVLSKEIKPNGPAANISWDDVTLGAKVEWDNDFDQQGKVVYIPQNHLNELSNKPEEITAMIKPVLFEKYPNIKHLYEKLGIDIKQTFNSSIEESVLNWFTGMGKIDTLRNEIKEVGDKDAINMIMQSYEDNIEKLKTIASLSNDEIKKYKEISGEVHSKKIRIQQIDEALSKIDSFIKNHSTSNLSVIDFTISILFEPSIESLPDELQKEINKRKLNWITTVEKELRISILEGRQKLEEEKVTLTNEINKTIENNRALIEKCKKSNQLQDYIEKLDKQRERVNRILDIERRITEEQGLLAVVSENLKSSVDKRYKELAEFISKIEELDQKNAEIVFSVEIDFNPEDYDYLSRRFNRKQISQFIENSEKLRIDLVREHPSEFLKSIYTKKQNILKGEDPVKCAVDALSFTEEIRFKAVMEQDSIGGFHTSSMTEGKQALFALTLLLNRESDTWPLLIDQPEDDLDSRSIYNQIVPYLRAQKKRRQIIMVSHNANLVIGADSEQIIVANQHGEDRKNDNNKKFDYVSGSLEFSKGKNIKEEVTLYSCGIREHACDILDGGPSAFEKRKNKYNI